MVPDIVFVAHTLVSGKNTFVSEIIGTLFVLPIILFVILVRVVVFVEAVYVSLYILAFVFFMFGITMPKSWS